MTKIEFIILEQTLRRWTGKRPFHGRDNRYQATKEQIELATQRVLDRILQQKEV